LGWWLRTKQPKQTCEKNVIDLDAASTSPLHLDSEQRMRGESMPANIISHR
jgi:hypothetical protein